VAAGNARAHSFMWADRQRAFVRIFPSLTVSHL
jgi:hypothetical protein